MLALYRAPTTTERSYYPSIRELWTRLLESRRLPFDVRAETSEPRLDATGSDQPDLTIYDRGGFPVVLAEIKSPDVDIADMARSTERNDQVGRYLAQTGAVLICNIRSMGLLAPAPGHGRSPSAPVPPSARDLLEVVHFWPNERDFREGRPISEEAFQAGGELFERAVTEFAPIAEPAVLARILARQARSAKAGLPASFSVVKDLLEDYRAALGLTFEEDDPKGAEFFRSSLIQTAYYGLFAGWTLWHRASDGKAFEWDHMERYLRIPFLGKLFHSFRHPDLLEELGLAPHLDRATATLARVDRPAFFARFPYPTVHDDRGPEAETPPPTALTYFYEPFLEAFDPDLRKELGVWYTPPEIVRYQIGKIEALLRDRLGCRRGFADERVIVLDPCCGTGAYLLEVVRRVAAETRQRGDDATLGAELLQAVAERVIGFEILTAPFVIAQLQLYLLLSDAAAPPDRQRRPAVFLTNALTGWDDPAQIRVHFPELREEHELAQRVKRDARIIVVVGNPPYNRFAGTALDEEADLVDHYKGITRIRRDGRLVQQGESLLYTRWGIRKQLLDDVYVRFFRLAEKRIGQHAEHGVVSFISNSSYLTGRSHPLMRESLLKSFHEVWVDNTNGDKYRTGKIVPDDKPGAGTSDQSVFSTDADPRGIQVGTCVTTLLKRRQAPSAAAETPIHVRDFWGRANDKRRALLQALGMAGWTPEQRRAAAATPAGPRDYEVFTSSADTRWMFVPRDTNAGYEAWPALDELFSTKHQGVNPNRGLDGSVIDTDRAALSDRMARYLSATTFAEAASIAPELAKPRADYAAEPVWTRLKARALDPAQIRPYLLFPLDVRWLYCEADLLNRPRHDFIQNAESNEFLVAVPQPRRASETRPLVARTLVDLHVHDRGSVCFPRTARAGALVASTQANVPHPLWARLARAWDLAGTLEDPPAHRLVSQLFRSVMATCHAPEYQQDHRDALAQDWAHVTIPHDRALFDRLVRAGDAVAQLLDPEADAEPTVREILGDERPRMLGVVRRRTGTGVGVEDLRVTVSYFGAAQGKWQPRAFLREERAVPEWGAETGDLHINDDVFLSNVPAAVWTFALGGYPVLKKWLGYRQANRRGDRPLTLAELRHLRSIIQRLAALVAFHPRLDELYQAAAADAFTAEELGLRS